jgi:sterol 3beta-glucosyltransferase
MAGSDDIKKIIGRKLTKKRRELSRPPVNVPDKFKDGDDAQEDVAAPKGASAQYMNQSVFSIIAAAGSKVDFNARFDDDSSDSEEDGTQSKESQAKVEAEQAGKDGQEASTIKSGMGKHRRKLSEHKLLKSLPKLNLRTIKERNYMSQSARASTSPESMSPRSRATPREAPVMSQMLQAQAQLKSPDALDDLQEEDSALSDEKDTNPSSALSKRLMEIFEFEKPERVISGKFLLFLERIMS